MYIFDKNNIEIYLNDEEKLRLENIVKELYKAKSIESDDIEEFLKFTIFIILYEYDKNKISLNEFYRQKKEIYKNSNDNTNKNDDN